MALTAGDTLPDATLLRMGEDGPEEVRLSERLAGRRVVLFGLPGAYTGVCTTAHVPSFIRTREAFAGKGVDEIICVAVNDPFVMKQWGLDTGATEAGLTLLADPAAEFTRAAGMEFTAPPVGFYNRSRRYALVARDGVIEVIQEDQPGTCDRSGGEALLEAI